MKNYEKILVLENDLKLPDVVADALEIEGKPYDTIFNFSNNIQYYRDETMTKIIENKDSLFLCYPSFVGFGNSFYGYLVFLNNLKTANIQLSMAIIYYPNLFNYIMNWIGELDCNTLAENKSKKVTIQMLKDVISYHDIVHTSYESVYVEELEVKDYTKLLASDIDEYLINKKDKVKIKETSDIVSVDYVRYDKENIEDSYIVYFKQGAYNKERNSYQYNDIRLKFNQIEKI